MKTILAFIVLSTSSLLFAQSPKTTLCSVEASRTATFYFLEKNLNSRVESIKVKLTEFDSSSNEINDGSETWEVTVSAYSKSGKSFDYSPIEVKTVLRGSKCDVQGVSTPYQD